MPPPPLTPPVEIVPPPPLAPPVEIVPPPPLAPPVEIVPPLPVAPPEPLPPCPDMPPASGLDDGLPHAENVTADKTANDETMTFNEVGFNMNIDKVSL
jgi:hypothetical protein